MPKQNYKRLFKQVLTDSRESSKDKLTKKAKRVIRELEKDFREIPLYDLSLFQHAVVEKFKRCAITKVSIDTTPRKSLSVDVMAEKTIGDYPDAAFNVAAEYSYGSVIVHIWRATGAHLPL